MLVPAVLEQRVYGKDARRAWRSLVTKYGAPAPGPAPTHMRVPPPAEVWRRIPSWEFHLANVDPGRARSIGKPRRVARQRLATAGMDQHGWQTAQVGQDRRGQRLGGGSGPIFSSAAVRGEADGVAKSGKLGTVFGAEMDFTGHLLTNNGARNLIFCEGAALLAMKEEPEIIIEPFELTTKIIGVVDYGVLVLWQVLGIEYRTTTA